MDQAPAAVLDHHEHIQQPERGGDGNKEVAGNDSLSVKTQERRPAQVASWSAWRASRQVLAHGPNSQLHEELIGRCQRIIVSGRTTTSASRQLKNRESNAREIRVTASIRRGLIPRSL